MIPTIYLIIIVAYIFLSLGFMTRSPPILLLSCFLLFGISVFIFKEGMDNFNNTLTMLFAGVNFGIASYISLKSTFEVMK